MRRFTMLPVLSLLLLVLPGTTPTADGTTTDIAVQRLLDAASKAGYVFASGGVDCPVDCDSLTSRCMIGYHIAPMRITPSENKLGTGDHQLCEEGYCSDHNHSFCDREFASAVQLLDAIGTRTGQGCRRSLGGVLT